MANIVPKTCKRTSRTGRANQQCAVKKVTGMKNEELIYVCVCVCVCVGGYLPRSISGGRGEACYVKKNLCNIGGKSSADGLVRHSFYFAQRCPVQPRFLYIALSCT